MDIYSNGLINFNDETIYSHPNLNLYSWHNLNKDNAPLMIFKSEDCKILKIEPQKFDGKLYCSSLVYGIKEIMADEELFLKLSDAGLKCGKKLQDYTGIQLIEILQNPEVIREAFHDWCIAYEFSLKSALKNPANNLGDLEVKSLGDGWYQ